jgi:hypothetical protein
MAGGAAVALVLAALLVRATTLQVTVNLALTCGGAARHREPGPPVWLPSSRGDEITTCGGWSW